MAKKIVAVRYGMGRAHPIYTYWFKEIGVKKSYPFNIFTSHKALSLLGPFNQVLGFIHSLFLPRAHTYFLTSTGCASAVILKKKLFKSRIIASNNDTFYPDLARAKGLRRKYMKWLASHVDGLISPSVFMENLAAPYIKAPHEIVSLFSDVERFAKVRPSKNNNVVAVGLGFNTKGSDLLFKAFQEYRKVYPDATLYALGETRFLQGLKPPPGVILTGSADPAKYFGKASLYVNASRHESFGVSVLEAMNAGLVPILTDKCGTAEIVSTIDKGLVVPTNARAITTAMIKYQGKNNTAIQKQVRKIAKEYTAEKSSENFQRTFKKMVKA